VDDAGNARRQAVTVAQPAPHLTIVVPAFNEGPNIEPVVREIMQTLDREPAIGTYEIVLVNDGSSDDTRAVIDRLAGQWPNVSSHHHDSNRGFGAALRTGFANSRGDAVTFITADGEIGTDVVVEMYRAFGDYDLVLSARERTVGTDRKVLTWGVELMLRIILGFIPEASGIYMVRGDLVRRMPLKSNTGLANLEVILFCQHWQRRIGKAGVTRARPRLSGASKVTNLPTILRTLFEMAKLRWRIVRHAQFGDHA
jgi:dolichol-phosphate mannosyltransferase